MLAQPPQLSLRHARCLVGALFSSKWRGMIPPTEGWEGSPDVYGLAVIVLEGAPEAAGFKPGLHTAGQVRKYGLQREVHCSCGLLVLCACEMS